MQPETGIVTMFVVRLRAWPQNACCEGAEGVVREGLEYNNEGTTGRGKGPGKERANVGGNLIAERLSARGGS